MATSSAAKKGGRPKAEPHARRTALSLMLREDELSLIHRAAEAESIPPAIFIRHVIVKASRAILGE